MKTIRSVIKHQFFSLKKSLFVPNYKGCRFIYAHYWNRCSLPTRDQINGTEQLFKNLINDGWQFITLDQLGEVSNFKEKEKKIFLSFDDGFSGLFKFWHPIAKKLNINYTIFINPGFVEKTTLGQDLSEYHLRLNNLHESMSWDYLKKINRSSVCNIESHGLSHLRLSNLNWRQFRNEIDKAHEMIGKQLNKSCRAFAWPYGTYHDIKNDQIKYLRRKYDFVFSAGREKKVVENGIINRDHFELSWPSNSIKYLLQRRRIYPIA